MKVRAAIGPIFPHLLDSLVSAIENSKKDDKLKPLIVLAGSNATLSFLKREIAGRIGGYINIEFLTPIDLAERIASLSTDELKGPIPPFADRVLVEQLLEEAGGRSLFKKSSTRRWLPRALLSTFTDLGEAGMDEKLAGKLLGTASAERLGERALDVLKLYQLYRKEIDRIGEDSISLFRRAIEVARRIGIPHEIYAFGFYDFNELQWELLEEIAGKGGGFTLFVPYEGGEAYRFVEQTIEKIRKKGFKLHYLEDASSDDSKECEIELVSAPGEEEEVRIIADRIIRLVSDNGYSFTDCAILLPSSERYLRLVSTVFKEAGIPYCTQGEALFRSSPFARGIMHLLELLTDDFRRAELVDFLSSAPLKVPEDWPYDIDPFSTWIKISAMEMVYGNPDEWPEISGELAKRAARSGRYSEGEVAAVQFVHELIKRIIEERLIFRETDLWGGFSERLTTLAIELMDFDSDDSAIIDSILALRKLDSIFGATSFTRFAEVLRELLAAPSSKRCPSGSYVRVMPLVMARGTRFEAVFIPGMVEGALPSRVRQDPLIFDNERNEINALSDGRVHLRQKMERLEEETLIFRLAVSSARSFLHCSYPRFEDETGNPNVRSSFVRFLPGSIEKWRHGVNGSEIRAKRFGSPGATRKAISENEFYFQGALDFSKGSGFLPANRFFWNAVRMVRERWGAKKLTPYDGVFRDKKALDEVTKYLEEIGRHFSPTSLQQYAGCPFSYFLSHLLGVEVIEEPEAITISPSLKGSLVHKIMAAIYSRLKKESLLPIEEKNITQAMGLSEEIVAGILDQAEKEQPVGLGLFWEMERRAIERTIRLYIEKEKEEDSKFVPVFFEKPFGYEDGDAASLDIGGREVYFKGRIDRIDRGPGDSFRVVDYKTGEVKGKDQEIDATGNLQLPVYLLAASSILRCPITSGKAEFRVVNIRSLNKRITLDGSGWEEIEAVFKQIVKTIVEGIENGIFFGLGGGDTCKRCPVRSACPSGDQDMFLKKLRSDKRAVDFLLLMGIDSAEGED